MKRITTLLAIMVLAVALAMAQAPEKFTYQAVVRNASNSLVANAPVGVRVSILQGSASGSVVYVETQTATTNANGLVTLSIGGGNVQQGAFADIDWANGTYFLKTETDPDGGSNYSISTTQQLLSVPYALYAKEAGNIPTNVGELTNDANYITLEDVPGIPTNVSAFTNDAGYITGYTETDPTVPAWAKEATKPAYDYSEIANTPTIPTVPTNVSAFTNDAGYITANDVPEQVNADWNATSGEAEILNKPTLFSGSYNDLTDKPTIPEEANNATLTIQRNESLVGTFTADASTNTTINIVVPTTTSDLVNNSGYITAADIPEIPTNVSAFTNDAGYLTTAQCGDIDICDLAELVAQLQQQVATLQQQIDSLQGQSGQDTTTNPIDTTTILLPTVFTSTASNITSTSAMVGGNVTSDGGASVIARGVCWSTSQNPTVNDSHTTDGGGMGSFTSNITGLAANTTYYVRAYATNSAGTAYGEEVTFSTLSAGGTAIIDAKSCPEAQTVTDHEGNEYATVQIGNQCWMRDNLRTTTSPSTGTYLIPAADVDYTYTGKHARWYNNDSAMYAPMNYGLLYNWNAAVDTFNTAYGETSVNTSSSDAVYVTFTGHRRGICPAGWHLPSDAEWTQLTNYVSSQSEFQCGGNSSYIAKALASTEGWNTYTYNCVVGNDPSTNNATGFSAVPAGGCYGLSFFDAGYTALFWSSTHYSSFNAYYCFLDHAYEDVHWGSNLKSEGLSVRCLRDETGGGGSGSSAVIDEKSCPGAQTVTDHEGNEYATVQIGNQCWMRDNLRTTTSPSTGTYLIPAADANYTYTGKQAFWYNNDSATYAPMNYGLLYNWNAAVDTFNTAYGETSVNSNSSNAVSVTFTGHRRGICPAGWHLPSDAEWTQLTNYVSSQSEYTCGGNSNYIAKALASTEGWDADTDNCVVGNDPSTNNATGFSAVPAGLCYGSSFLDAGYDAYFWSSTQNGSDGAYYRTLGYGSAYVLRFGTNLYYGFSVRCLRDETGGGGSGSSAVIDEKSCPAAQTVTDHEGNVYATVQIGNQCWMRDNLRTTTSPSTGTYLIPAANANITYTGKQARWYYNDSATYAPQNYGLLYNWNAAVDTFNTAYGETSVNTSSSNAVSVTFTGPRRGICPAGWHLPSDAEWTQLTNYVSSQSEYTCSGYSSNIAKALASAEGWNTYTSTCAVGNDLTANNATGFSAVPAGGWLGSSFSSAGGRATFWSSTQYGSYRAYYRDLYYYYADVYRDYYAKGYGYSVRCLRD